MREKLARLSRSYLPALAALAALNLSIAWRLFGLEYGDHFSSIEGAWVASARYISGHWGDFSWWPLWHCGMPYQDTYVPLVHLAVALVATLRGISAAYAYHAVTGAAYAAGPLTLYLMAHRLGASRGSAFLSALAYSLFSPSALLMPDVARDVGGLWFSRRLQVMLAYGEGPHVTAMTLLPVAILALEGALRKRTSRAVALAALALAVIFLTNIPGTMATGLAAFCWLCVQPAGERRAAWAIAAAAALLAYALACYGIPPSSLRITLGNIGPMQAGFSAAMRSGPLLLGGALAAAAALGWLMARIKVPLVLRFAALNSALLALLVLTADPDKFELLPQAGRLHLEMEMGMCMILGAAVWFLYTRVPKWLRPLAVVVLLAPIGLQYSHYRERAAIDTQPVDVAKRSESASARWVAANLPGRRVYATGSTSFWWNAFTDNPQLIGCCDQNLAVPILKSVPYLVNMPGDAVRTARIKPYFQALGVDAMIVNGPASTDEYKDIRSPERFDALFPVLHREAGDTIYAIPRRSTSLAHVLREGEAVPLRGIPMPLAADVLRYAAAVEDPARPAAGFTWIRGDTARISARLAPSDLVSVQVAWFPGWKASVAGRAIPDSADGLGFQLLRPVCDGACEITLHWTGNPDGIPSGIVTLAALIFIAYIIASPKRLPLS